MANGIQLKLNNRVVQQDLMQSLKHISLMRGRDKRRVLQGLTNRFPEASGMELLLFSDIYKQREKLHWQTGINPTKLKGSMLASDRYGTTIEAMRTTIKSVLGDSIKKEDVLNAAVDAKLESELLAKIRLGASNVCVTASEYVTDPKYHINADRSVVEPALRRAGVSLVNWMKNNKFEVAVVGTGVAVTVIMAVLSAKTDTSSHRVPMGDHLMTNTTVQREVDEGGLGDLETALGDRWNALTGEHKGLFRREWQTSEDDVKKFIVDVYSNPKKVYGEFPQDKKKRFDAFKVSDLDVKTLEEYKKAFPWINTTKPELSDKLLIHWLEYVRGRVTRR